MKTPCLKLTNVKARLLRGTRRRAALWFRPDKKGQEQAQAVTTRLVDGKKEIITRIDGLASLKRGGADVAFMRRRLQSLRKTKDRSGENISG